jgi:hypothetical protein
MAIAELSSRILAEPLQPAPPRPPPAAPKPQAVAKDTVTISSSARTLQEESEAPLSVVEAASTGDLQAQAQLTIHASAANPK